MDVSEDQLIEAISRLLSGGESGGGGGVGAAAAGGGAGAGGRGGATGPRGRGGAVERGVISARDLGAKAITVNVSDVAAMAASPRYALVAIAVPVDVEAAWVMELIGGMRDACAEYAVALVGGDTNRADLLVLSVAVVGEVAPGRALLRSGARAGNRIVVTGELGAAAGGLALSRAEPDLTSVALSAPWGRALVEALERPVARVGEAQILARSGATAMMDLSDGLAKDLSRLCESSGVGARVTVDAVPISAALVDGASAMGVNALSLALSGGEDYELLATMPAGSVEAAATRLLEDFGVRLTVVGEVTEEPRLVSVDAEGRTSELALEGWDHFGPG